MINSFLRNIFSKKTVVATSSKIKGSHSNGRLDSPGVWWKDL